MPKSSADLISEAKQRVKEVSAQDVIAMRKRGDQIAVVDVREDREWNLGRVSGASHMSRGTLEGKIETAIPRNRKVVLYCGSGNRSTLAADTLQQMGYSDVASLRGGYRAWVEADGDIEG